jgi:hypothetical protein
MAPRETDDRKQSRDEEAERENGGGEESTVDEQELASYLQERIKPGLNRGAIPLLARSIAREIAHDAYHADEDEEEDQDDDDLDPTDLEADLHTLQQRLGEDWTLFYAVHGGDAWLTAETQDATQRVEAPSAEVLVKAVALLSDGGGRAGARRSKDGDEDED